MILDAMPEIHFLPWVRIDNEFSLGPVAFAPWSSVRERLSTEAASYLDRYFTRYVQNDGQPMYNVTVCYLEEDPLAEIGDSGRESIIRSVDVLTFGAITDQLGGALRRDNGGFGVSNSERFQLVTQRLQGFGEYVTVVSGGMRHTWGINDIHFCIPWSVGSNFYHIDHKYLVPLADIIHDPTGSGQSLTTAFEWFRYAHTGSDEVSESSRVVMMTTVFEILFAPEEGHAKRGQICRALHDITSCRGLRSEDVTIDKTTTQMAAPAAWFNSFYQLRSAIVHGDRIAKSELEYAATSRRVGQRTVAALVFWEVVTWRLFREGHIGRGAIETAADFASFAGKTEPAPSLIKYVASSMLGISDMHGSLGWSE
jgi:hypothetical protein